MILGLGKHFLPDVTNCSHLVLFIGILGGQWHVRKQHTSLRFLSLVESVERPFLSTLGVTWQIVHSLRVLGMMSRPWLRVRIKMQEEGALPWETPSPGGTDKQRKHRPSSSAMSLVGGGGGNQRGPCIISWWNPSLTAQWRSASGEKIQHFWILDLGSLILPSTNPQRWDLHTSVIPILQVRKPSRWLCAGWHAKDFTWIFLSRNLPTTPHVLPFSDETSKADQGHFPYRVTGVFFLTFVSAEDVSVHIVGTTRVPLSSEPCDEALCLCPGILHSLNFLDPKVPWDKGSILMTAFHSK